MYGATISYKQIEFVERSKNRVYNRNFSNAIYIYIYIQYTFTFIYFNIYFILLLYEYIHIYLKFISK